MTMELCELCNEEVGKDEELYECERCEKNVCLGCTNGDYPFSTTMCSECQDDFMAIHDDWFSKGGKNGDL